MEAACRQEMGDASQVLRTSATATTRMKRVIVVEDDADTRRLLAWMLQREGYAVLEAEDGVGLLQHLQESIWNGSRAPIDVIVSDIQMPDLTALEVLKSLPGRNFGAPIVLVTAHHADRARPEAAALGAVAVLQKPIVWDQLRLVMQEAISTAHARRQYRAVTPRSRATM